MCSFDTPCLCSLLAIVQFRLNNGSDLLYKTGKKGSTVQLERVELAGR